MPSSDGSMLSRGDVYVIAGLVERRDCAPSAEAKSMAMIGLAAVLELRASAILAVLQHAVAIADPGHLPSAQVAALHLIGAHGRLPVSHVRVCLEGQRLSSDREVWLRPLMAADLVEFDAAADTVSLSPFGRASLPLMDVPRETSAADGG